MLNDEDQNLKLICEISKITLVIENRYTYGQLKI